MKPAQAHLVETVKIWIEAVRTDYEGSVAINVSALNRMNWFAAISGLAILNTWTSFLSLTGKSTISSESVSTIILAWFITGTLSIISHFAIDEGRSIDHLSFIKQRELLFNILTLFSTPDREPEKGDTQVLNAALDLTHEKLVALRKTQLSAAFSLRLLERITFLSMLISLLLSAISFAAIRLTS